MPENAPLCLFSCLGSHWFQIDVGEDAGFYNIWPGPSVNSSGCLSDPAGTGMSFAEGTENGTVLFLGEGENSVSSWGRALH